MHLTLHELSAQRKYNSRQWHYTMMLTPPLPFIPFKDLGQVTVHTTDVLPLPFENARLLGSETFDGKYFIKVISHTLTSLAAYLNVAKIQWDRFWNCLLLILRPEVNPNRYVKHHLSAQQKISPAKQRVLLIEKNKTALVLFFIGELFQGPS